MKVKLPKDLRGVVFPRVLTIELNGFDIDVFLPSLFFTILAEGRGKARQTNDPRAITHFIDALSHHPALQGFDDAEGRRLLERLVRTVLITTGGIGRARKGEQIVSVVPYTLLAYKPGLPSTVRRQRGADTFIYQALREHLLHNDMALRNSVKQFFGHGVTIGNIPELGGTYDGVSELDTLTRLSIAFLDGFENTRPGLSRERNIPSSCPALADAIAVDLLRYLNVYHDLMPRQAFTYHILALINFELFNYTLKLVHAVNDLVKQPDKLPPAMSDTVELSPPQLYLDFTDVTGGRSQEMAKACVHRDVEAYQRFLSSNLLLRQLDHYVIELKRNARRRTEIERVLQPDLYGAHYLRELLLLQHNSSIGSSIEASARYDEDRIRQENSRSDEDEDLESLTWLDEITNTAESDVDRVVNLLVEGQREMAMGHFIQWYWGTGGMKKTHGVLSGSVPYRQTWQYAPTNDLLSVLVQLAAVRVTLGALPADNYKRLQPIRLQDFLAFLETRFGILVDHPPAPFVGAEYTAAARDNLRAMLRRLRQMGIFRDLSDDFTVQTLLPPYSENYLMRVGVK